MLAAANIDLYIGDAVAVQRRIDAAWEPLDRIGVLRLQQPRVELALLRARTRLALGGGDPEHVAVRGIESPVPVWRVAIP